MSEEHAYQPDAALQAKRDAYAQKSKPSVTTDKPITLRVAKTRPNTQSKHYPRKAKKRGPARDPRLTPKFY